MIRIVIPLFILLDGTSNDKLLNNFNHNSTTQKEILEVLFTDLILKTFKIKLFRIDEIKGEFRKTFFSIVNTSISGNHHFRNDGFSLNTLSFDLKNNKKVITLLLILSVETSLNFNIFVEIRNLYDRLFKELNQNFEKMYHCKVLHYFIAALIASPNDFKRIIDRLFQNNTDAKTRIFKDLKKNYYSYAWVLSNYLYVNPKLLEELKKQLLDRAEYLRKYNKLLNESINSFIFLLTIFGLLGAFIFQLRQYFYEIIPNYYLEEYRHRSIIKDLLYVDKFSILIESYPKFKFIRGILDEVLEEYLIEIGQLPKKVNEITNRLLNLNEYMMSIYMQRVEILFAILSLIFSINIIWDIVIGFLSSMASKIAIGFLLLLIIAILLVYILIIEPRKAFKI